MSIYLSIVQQYSRTSQLAFRCVKDLDLGIIYIRVVVNSKKKNKNIRQCKVVCELFLGGGKELVLSLIHI